MTAETRSILQTLRAHKGDLVRRYPIHRMAIFGSVVRGDGRPDSDVDILVDVEPSIGLEFVSLANELENLLGRKVDLVSRRAVKPMLMERITPDLIDV
ncbi:nucleotidyltransferase family protein [Candidatus Sumerlaeota bacterium]|nr:nucleotidyltransferase family protein [Candidatus Sumerlaeota bacterium]